MFNQLFQSCVHLWHFNHIISKIGDLLQEFEKDYLKDYDFDKNKKNAAIDAIIQILQEHKDK
jgi:hypothetical protein